MLEVLKRLIHEEEGQSMVEYGLILALVAVAVITILTTMGDELSNIFTDIKDAISGSGGGS
ncbi:Flp family type IVb pilin [Halanaerobacter jeridensis]|uniref:Pilus assembly protein Flp/PilA n=1 Tax=Halanaerobacter jeridensis TaxID=706427 RepID=A0A939BPR6_9FIRM|nr:Flp family type IVb pilin [Halanaerobacter jeridensis]MBM7557198.1 pilus assembly protein Flp/PilA [Halanaerobacter jeridensis]